MIVYLSTTLNTGHLMGRGKETIIFPVLARDEEIQMTTQESMFNYVRLSDGGFKRLKNVRSEVEIISEIGSRVVGDNNLIQWSKLKNHNTIRKMISEIILVLNQSNILTKQVKNFIFLKE